MTEGSTNIRCPHCGYPYAMTPMQLSVYIGRSMGCMHCGKSFPVVAPPPPPPPDELLTSSAAPPVIDRPASAEAPFGGPIGALGGPPITSHGSPGAPPWPAAGQPESSRTESLGNPSPRTAAPPAMLGVLALAATVLFVVMATLAAVVGFAGSSENAIKAVSHSKTPLTLLGVAFAFAAVGTLIGLAGVLQIRAIKPPAGHRRPRFGIAGAATLLGLSELFLASLLALLVMPSLVRGLAESHRAVCQTNLQQVGYALIARASEQPDGRFADSLGDLVGDGMVKADLVVCPAGPHPAAPSDDPIADQSKKIADGQHVTYRYLGKGLAMKATGGKRVSTNTVLAYEPPGLHGDAEGFHVLFADGVVVFVDKGPASKLHQELQNGQNPPPSAERVRP